ncbi:MAG TPA: hypothetical protein VFA70_14290 [Dehalococcoidia bacterium]|nr:hypothetical protein [Dehalococcoidia bacterium]
MARSLWLVMSRCSDPTREDEFNRWYEEVHMRDVLEYPEFIAAQRWQLAGPPSRGEPTAKYLALYELDSDDPRGVLERVLTTPDVTKRGPRRHECMDVISLTCWTALGVRQEASQVRAGS